MLYEAKSVPEVATSLSLESLAAASSAVASSLAAGRPLPIALRDAGSRIADRRLTAAFSKVAMDIESDVPLYAALESAGEVLGRLYVETVTVDGGRGEGFRAAARGLEWAARLRAFRDRYDGAGKPDDSAKRSAEYLELLVVVAAAVEVGVPATIALAAAGRASSSLPCLWAQRAARCIEDHLGWEEAMIGVPADISPGLREATRLDGQFEATVNEVTERFLRRASP